MSPFDDALRSRAGGRLISPGTQVVLLVRAAVREGSGFKKPGSVGVIVECPPNHELPYIVQFADGSTVSARRRELTLRRTEVDDALPAVQEDLRPYVIYRCQVGSKAFGLATDESDDDLRGIYLPPARMHWALARLPEQVESATTQGDEVYWELEKFLRLALKANPNVLETLWTPLVHYADATAQELRHIRRAFLSRHLYKTYAGYVLSQFRRMAAAHKSTGRFKPKHAMHLVRLLHSGIAALESGEIKVDASAHRGELLSIRRGELSFEEVRQRALELDRRFQEALEVTALPEQPDFESVNAFLVRARRRMVDA
jgi:hypothetical protein